MPRTLWVGGISTFKAPCLHFRVKLAHLLFGFGAVCGEDGAMSSNFADVSLVHNVRPWGGAASDIAIADAKIVSITPAASVAPQGALDGRGLLAIPGIINTHAHVDKSWWGMPWQSYGGEGTTDGRI